MEDIYYRARNVQTIGDLRAVSKSPLVDMEDIESIKIHFKSVHNVIVKGFDSKDLFSVKVTLAGYDDMLLEFPEIQNGLNTIRYSPNLIAMGDWSNSGISRVGRAGLRDYGTGIHEAAHALDYVRSGFVNGIYSGKIIRMAQENLGYRSNSIEYKKLRYRLTGDAAEADVLEEVFAYAMESEKGGASNVLSNEIYRLTKEVE